MNRRVVQAPRVLPREKTVYSDVFELTAAFALAPLPTTARGEPYDEARLLVRLDGEPLGFVTVPLGAHELSRAAVLQVVERQLGLTVLTDGEDEPSGPRPRAAEARSWHELDGERASSVSVVVCTRNRAGALVSCLRSLRELDHRAIDFIVVDNAPGDDSTYRLVHEIAGADDRFQYVCEPQPGLSRARNRGLARARGEIVAYTDDDVRVDPLWVKALLRGFARRPDVGCVTGLVASASLELPAEQYFDGRVSWSSSCEAAIFDARRARGALYPYAAGTFGTGANFAVRTGALRAIGEFDETLGAGSPCDGGEDLDIFVRFIRAGYAISYEPAALVWHEHRAGREDLRRQMYSYGRALSAYLFKYACSPRSGPELLQRLPHGLRHLGVLGARSHRVGAQTGLAYEPMLAEVRGLLSGPFAYARARRDQDPARRRAVAP